MIVQADARRIPLPDESVQSPICVDFYCGLGGWAEGFLVEGFEVIGFDIERHDYGTGGYPGRLVLQDVLTIHGLQFKPLGNRLACFVASPPCQEPSYRAMPWKRAKALNAAGPPHKFVALFEACFRIQREASEALGRHIPMVVENVVGAQRWVGRAAWHFGSYYLWGDVPALMPMTLRSRKSQHIRLCETPKGTGATSWFFGNSKHEARYYGVKNEGQDWNRNRKTGEVSPRWRIEGMKTVAHLNKRDGHPHTRHLTNQAEHVKGFDGAASGRGNLGKNQLGRLAWSTSVQRKAASAMIAKIPFSLSQHIAHCFLAYHNHAEKRTRNVQRQLVSV